MPECPKPYYQEPGITIYCADCRDILPQLEPVDLVLTDPEYEQDKRFDWLKIIKSPKIAFTPDNAQS